MADSHQVDGIFNDQYPGLHNNIDEEIRLSQEHFDSLVAKGILPPDFTGFVPNSTGFDADAFGERMAPHIEDASGKLHDAAWKFQHDINNIRQEDEVKAIRRLAMWTMAGYYGMKTLLVAAKFAWIGGLGWTLNWTLAALAAGTINPLVGMALLIASAILLARAVARLVLGFFV